jgi:hypothetical protein
MKYIIILSSLLLLLQACSKDKNTEDQTKPDSSFSESFDEVNDAGRSGWVFSNNSIEKGTTQWNNPSAPTFNAYSSATGSGGYIWADFNSTSSAAGVISNWAVSPSITMQNGDTISFYTRAELFFFNDDSTDFVNRLQVRMNRKNTGTITGNGTNPGDFDVLLLDINPDYKTFQYSAFINRDPEARLAYPHRWTRFEAIVSGLDSPTEGRFAFRYFVEDGGNNGRGSSIGIDEVNYRSKK